MATSRNLEEALLGAFLIHGKRALQHFRGSPDELSGRNRKIFDAIVRLAGRGHVDVQEVARGVRDYGVSLDDLGRLIERAIEDALVPLGVEALEDRLREERTRARITFIANQLLAVATNRAANPLSEAKELAQALWRVVTQ